VPLNGPFAKFGPFLSRKGKQWQCNSRPWPSSYFVAVFLVATLRHVHIGVLMFAAGVGIWNIWPAPPSKNGKETNQRFSERSAAEFSSGDTAGGRVAEESGRTRLIEGDFRTANVVDFEC
jgi:hypothetical protein